LDVTKFNLEIKILKFDVNLDVTNFGAAINNSEHC